ncbi:translation initiation factor IF-2, partial [uncultured Thalassolituus sp.]|uniref:translation initiation factor IF-2 n=1 Tax=uncultured Thalassolituus sp. TaxID=285273 RepID=UPI00261DA343
MSKRIQIPRIAVIGLGLIGCSWIKALRVRGCVDEVRGYDRNLDSMQLALSEGLIDSYSEDIGAVVQNADLVIVSVPIMAMRPVLESIRAHIAEHTVITDVGSVKGSVATDVAAVFGKGFPRFVLGHPIAGSERSGVMAADENLYVRHKVIITPEPHTSKEALALVRDAWTAVGADLEHMSVSHHDEVLAATSHLPHLLAYSLVDTLANSHENKEIFKPVKRDVKIPESITIRDLANRMAEQSSSLIKHLLGMGVTATINQALAADTAEYLVQEFGHNPIRENKAEEIIKRIKETKSENLRSRPPIITVMGHVDHGKTSLLDALRSANVVSGEFGGITQHIGAYQINHNSNKLTFIDTPGHAAFTEMRARGSKLTDIVVLVVAADDGVKPQTVESIKHAKAAKVPIVVAINKCDLPKADPQKIKNQLLEHELIAEELSGDVLMIEISTKTKKNLDKLVEAIVLQTEILDLKTNYDSKATGVVLESEIDIGRGPVATVIIISGTLKKGDYFVSGLKHGKARAIVNDLGNNINEALPASPVEVLGINGAAKAGDDFLVLDNEKEAKALCDARIQETKDEKNPLTFVTQESAFKDKVSEELNIIIKSDVHGSSEAIKNAITQIKHAEVKQKIILSDIGMLPETDVTLAKASNAILIAFNVNPT